MPRARVRRSIAVFVSIFFALTVSCGEIAFAPSAFATDSKATTNPADATVSSTSDSMKDGRVTVDASRIDRDQSLPDDAQSGQVVEKVKAETTCAEDKDGSKICATLGDPDKPALKAHAALPLPKNVCRAGVRSSDRTNGCVGYPLTVKHHSGKGAVLGTLTGTVYVYQYSATKQTSIANQLTIVTSKTTGTGNKFSIVGNTPKCSGSCARSGSVTSLAGKGLQAGKTLNAESYFNWTGKKARSSQLLSWNLTLKHQKVAQTIPFSYSGASPVRCDKEFAKYSAGCIMAKGAIAIGYDKSSYPSFARHVTDAQKSGLPGKTSPLKRLKDGQASSKNRSKACPSRLKRPSSYSCDEYPFASTQQGAYYGGGTGRTFSKCRIDDKAYPVGAKGAKGFSACMIPEKENSAAGSALSNFYKQSRVLTGDAFYVQID